MKQKKPRIFKCQKCKDIIPTLKLDYKKGLANMRKYINKKIVCKRCFYHIKEENRLEPSKPTKNITLQQR